ncbi:TPA: hypothetical protein ACP4LY_002763 [Escherichia coli]|nr:hypothetical protein [Escherichia coli]EIY7175242.1 hypothetical protein [Escherichia coli]HBC0992452.1 hypothetical protein [Escherichia coli]
MKRNDKIPHYRGLN